MQGARKSVDPVTENLRSTYKCYYEKVFLKGVDDGKRFMKYYNRNR